MARAIYSNGVDVFRKAIRGNYDLLLLLVERVESVEELFLSTLLASNELDIVHQQHIDSVKTIPEADHSVKAE